MDTATSIESLVGDTELRHINFFNGRLLTAEDLSDEQNANRSRARHLGRAVGAGIAYGLQVDIAHGSPSEDAIVEILEGLAVNRAGQTLRLACTQTISLVTPPTAGTEDQCVFADCSDLPSGLTLAGQGYYVLTIAPASKKDSLAPVSGLGNRLAECNSRYLVDGVQFRLLPMSVVAGSTDERARNEIAYQSFAFNVGNGLTAALNATTESLYGLETLVPSGRLTEYDVPLAVIQLTDAGINLIDVWAARRRVTRPDSSQPWNYFVGDRRISEGEAMFLQFQDHLRALQSEAAQVGASLTLSDLEAEDRFKFLPAAGVLPVGTGLFDWETFLGPHAPVHLTEVEIELWSSLLRRSFAMEPIAVANFGAGAGIAPTPLNVYQVPGRNEVLFMRSENSRIRIFVTNSSSVGAGVVFAVSQETNLEWNADALQANQFQIDELPDGPYRVSATFDGFNSFESSIHHLRKGRTTDVQMMLSPSAPEESETPEEEEEEPEATGPTECIKVSAGDDIFDLKRAYQLCIDPDPERVPKGFKSIAFGNLPSDVKVWLLQWQAKFAARKDDFRRADLPVTGPIKLMYNPEIKSQSLLPSLGTGAFTYAVFGKRAHRLRLTPITT